MGTEVATKNRFMVYFDFTTVHSKGKFVGRTGQVGIETTDTIEEVNKNLEEVRLACAKFIYSQKPKWNILSLNVTNIKQQ